MRPGRRASGGGTKWGRLLQSPHCLPSPGSWEAQRRSQDGGVPHSPKPEPRRCRFVQGPGVAKCVGAVVPRPGQRPPPGAFPDSDGGSRNGGPRRRGGLGRSGQIDGSWELRARTFRQLAGAPAPASRFRRVTRRALLRSLRGNPEPRGAPRLPPAPARAPAPTPTPPGDAPAPIPPLPPAPARRLRKRCKSQTYREALGCGLGDEHLVVGIAHATVLVTYIL